MICLLIDTLYISNELNYIASKSFKKYINNCKKSKKYKRIIIKKEIPYISICLSVLNMENYIKQNLFSILNQSFQDFEIIIINDKSNDNTEIKIKEIQIDDDRIKIINHLENYGVYRSRLESILNAKGKNILLMDPDDMYLNENLFQELYNFNIKNNLDIIEFSVYQQMDGSRKLIYPDNHFQNHFHGFKKKIIYQPDLSEILFYIPNTKEYSHTICRNIWNKMIRLEVFLKMHNYIGNGYFNKFIITSDDIFMNIINYNFANNYSNIKIPGYLYNIRKISMSNGDGGIQLKIIRSINYFLYFQLLYRYIKDFHKDRNFLFFEMKNLNNFLLNIKNYNIKDYISKTIAFITNILSDKYISKDFYNYLSDLLNIFKLSKSKI